MSKLSTFVYLLIVCSITLFVASIGFAPNPIGEQLTAQCKTPFHPANINTNFHTGSQAVDHFWCVFAKFLSLFANSPFSIGLTLWLLSGAVQVWAYLSQIMSTSSGAGSPGPTTVIIALLVSQLIGLHFMMTAYWSFSLVNRWKRMGSGNENLKSGANSRILLSTLGMVLSATSLAVTNTESWAYRWSQLPFQFYPLAAAVIYTISRPLNGELAAANEARKVANTFRFLSWISLALWWAGWSFILFEPQSHSHQLVKRGAVLNPHFFNHFASFPDWQLADPIIPHWRNIHGGHIFAFADIILPAGALFVIYRVYADRQPKAATRHSILGSLFKIWVGGPGFAFGRAWADLVENSDWNSANLKPKSN